MGQDYGKQCFKKGEDYFNEQLELYRWRADPQVNYAISRVYFTSKNLLMNKKKLENFVHTQLQSNNYVDIPQISCLKEANWRRQGEEVMTFENYSANLACLQQLLSIEEILYVLQVLLNGHETIFKRFGKTYVDMQCCFLTEKDELRVWINTNPTINQFFDNVTCQLSEANVINHIIRLCGNLSEDSVAFRLFEKQLNAYLQKDLLHHVCFSSVRRFINRFAYSHTINIPLNLGQIAGRLRSRSNSLSHSRQSSKVSLHSRQNSKCGRHSSVSVASEGSYEYASRGLPSTGYHLAGPFELTPLNRSSNQSSNVENRNFQFYRPEQPAVKKLSTWDINSSIKSQKRSLNRSDVAGNRNSSNLSVTSSFSKKGRPQFYEIHNIMTPKNDAKTRSRLESTAGESFLGHSKNISQMTVSKIMHCNSTMNIFDNSSNNAASRKLEKKNNKVCFHDDQRRIKEMRPRPGTEQNMHSRQPSFDENSSSLFVSPASELVNFDGKGTKRHVNLAKIQAVSQFDQSEEQEEDLFDPVVSSTRGNMSPSQHLTRQVSGLVSNHELHMFQSRGSFLSFENSSASDYKGALVGLGRSAKMVSIPTSKRIERSSQRGIIY